MEATIITVNDREGRLYSNKTKSMLPFKMDDVNVPQEQKKFLCPGMQMICNVKLSEFWNKVVDSLVPYQEMVFNGKVAEISKFEEHCLVEVIALRYPIRVKLDTLDGVQSLRDIQLNENIKVFVSWEAFHVDPGQLPLAHRALMTKPGAPPKPPRKFSKSIPSNTGSEQVAANWKLSTILENTAECSLLSITLNNNGKLSVSRRTAGLGSAVVPQKSEENAPGTELTLMSSKRSSSHSKIPKEHLLK